MSISDSKKHYTDGNLTIDWDFVVSILRGEQPAGGEGACMMADDIEKLTDDGRILIAELNKDKP